MGGAMEQTKITVVLETDGGPIRVDELSSFLYYFRAVYVAAIKVGVKEPVANDFVDIEEQVRQIGYELPKYTPMGGIAFARARVSPDLLLIDVRRDNPLLLVLEGAVIGLTAAVILSGGRVDMRFFKANLPPLGTGIAALRAAFRGRPSGEEPLPRSKQPSRVKGKKARRKAEKDE
jgi:hypothetical protein